MEIHNDFSKVNVNEMREIYNSVGWMKHTNEIINKYGKRVTLQPLQRLTAGLSALDVLFLMAFLMQPFTMLLFIEIFKNRESPKK